jgi:hypothetical protein
MRKENKTINGGFFIVTNSGVISVEKHDHAVDVTEKPCARCIFKNFCGKFK